MKYFIYRLQILIAYYTYQVQDFINYTFMYLKR